ncbi:Peptidase E [compost metagenome]
MREGAAYLGWSAGSNLTCPTICTTNDMPITDPQGFDALGLLSFQINPHYTNAHPPGHRGETRAQRLAEYCTLNPSMPVLGLPEGAALRVRGDKIALVGPHDAPLFLGTGEPRVFRPGPVEIPA